MGQFDSGTARIMLDTHFCDVLTLLMLQLEGPQQLPTHVPIEDQYPLNFLPCHLDLHGEPLG